MTDGKTAIPDPALVETTTMRKLKRSRVMHVTSLMATATFSLAACGAPQVQAPEPEPALAYTSLNECKAANDITDAECDAGYLNARDQAEKTAPRYASREECEGQWGPSQCQPNTSNNGSFFTPLLTGFVIGQLLNGGGYRGGGALYRDRDGQYGNGYGGYLGRDYRTGRPVVRNPDGNVVRQAPSRVQSRTTVVSRGGFGGGGRSYGG